MLKMAKTIIKHFEGCELKAYKDVAGHWTVGYGHLITSKSPFYDDMDDVKTFFITQEQAEYLLDIDIQQKMGEILKIYPTFEADLNLAQQAAVLSFVYNVGIGNFKGYTVFKLIKQKIKAIDVARYLLKYHYASGKPIKGLLRRRIVEALLFCNGDIKFTQEITPLVKQNKFNFTEITQLIEAAYDEDTTNSF